MRKKLLAIFFASALLVFGCIEGNNSSFSSIQTNENIKNSEGESNIQTPIASNPDASFYKSFSKEEFEKAKREGKTIFLEFHANWCPVCATQEVNLQAAFSDPKLPFGIAGFRVNYKDNETDSDEENLARAYGITYQYSKVIIGASGDVLLKEVATPWSKEQTIEKLGLKAG